MYTCDECFVLLEGWERVYSWSELGGELYICADCFDALFLDMGREERASLIGSESMTVQQLKSSQ